MKTPKTNAPEVTTEAAAPVAMAIHRYIITNENGTVLMPTGARVVSLNLSSKGIAIFAIVNTGEAVEMDPVNFRVLKTGEAFTSADAATMEFVGSITIPGAPALHVFRVTA